MNISADNESLGKLEIELYPEIFPLGVRNFLEIVKGSTYKISEKNIGPFTCEKEVRRSYDGCVFFAKVYNNYIVSGDIYQNDGTSAGTIYDDQPIYPIFGDYYYRHNLKGLVSLVSYKSDSGENLYDSTFMITLDEARPTNELGLLDNEQIVIGTVIKGLDILDKINALIKPFAGKKYPNIIIKSAGIISPKIVLGDPIAVRRTVFV